MSETLFISDLHLSAKRPDITRHFLSFVAGRAAQAERLYILGDLFDAYIGDDDNSSPHREVKQALRKLADSGIQLHFQHGNRDFLAGQRFCQETGAELLGDYAVIDLYGERVLLTHGDLLCTDDHLYQAARLRVRSKEWQNYALSKPLFVRQLYARWYRFKSGLDKSKKSSEIMDVNQETVVATMREYGVSNVVHGHTHRPALHDLEVDGRPARRIVLAEWNPAGQYLWWNSSGAYALAPTG